MIFAKALILLRAAMASGLGLKRILSLVVQYAPLITALLKLFRKEAPKVEGLDTAYHHSEETGDTSAVEEVVRKHRRNRRGGRVPVGKPRP